MDRSKQWTSRVIVFCSLKSIPRANTQFVHANWYPFAVTEDSDPIHVVDQLTQESLFFVKDEHFQEDIHVIPIAAICKKCCLVHFDYLSAKKCVQLLMCAMFDRVRAYADIQHNWSSLSYC